MKIYFDSAFDGRTWPCLHGKRQGTLGEIWVGRSGMLGLLETLLGLRGPEVPEGVRVASLVPYLSGKKDAFWASSAEVDPFGVARELLYLQDFLWESGWHGEAVTPRLADLSELTQKIVSGQGQRLSLVLGELDAYIGELPRITLFEQVDTLPCLWQRLFNKLETMGAEVETKKPYTIDHKDGDLGLAGRGVFKPVGDSSLQLVRPGGVLQAAQEIAAWLAAVADKEGLQDTVIIGGDSILDAALHQFGLPVTSGGISAGMELLLFRCQSSQKRSKRR